MPLLLSGPGSSAASALLLALLLAACRAQNYNISVIAGTGATSFSGDGGPGTSAALRSPYAVAVDKTNSYLYISDYSNNRVRKLSLSTGIITTFAGTGSFGSSGDGGYATSALLKFPTGLVLDSSDEYLYISDFFNYVIRRVQMSTNIISLYAGNYESTGSTDGATTSAKFFSVYHIAMDSSNNMYLADRDNNKIRKITYSSSIVSTFAGTGAAGSSGDGGPATAAPFWYPKGVAVDAADTYVYIADTQINRIRRVSLLTNIITTFAGTGVTGFSGDGGAATSAKLYYPEGLALDGSGNLFVADFNNNRIRKVAVSSSIITTFAGTGSTTYSNEMSVYATAANLNYPRGVAVDSNDNVYVMEYSGNRVRKVTVNLTPTSQPSSEPSSQPSRQPSSQPSRQPSSQPSRQPSSQPSRQPSSQPSRQPTSRPTSQPSSEPSSQPSRQPSSQPSRQPTSRPTSQPSSEPSSQPSRQPTSRPTSQPSSEPSSKPSSHPTSQPSSEPSSGPTCGAGSQVEGSGCSKCAAGKFASLLDSDSCIDCPAGTYSDTQGAASCQPCPGASYSVYPGSTSCEAYYINAPQSVYVTVFVLSAVAYLSLVALSGGSPLVILAFSAVPYLDIYSDMLYIMTNTFFDLGLLVTIILVFALANCRFVYDLLYLRRAYPAMQEFPGRYLVGSNMLWLGHDSGRPLVNGKRHRWSHEGHDSIDKLLQFYLLWIYLIMLQMLYVVLLYPLWIVVYSAFLVFWFGVGLFLFQTKLIAVGRLRNVWFSTWTQSDAFSIETSIDVGVLHESTFYQFILETAPQLLLQITNGALSNSISSPPSVISITFSVLIAVNGLYHFGYYLFWKGVKFADIPLPLELKVTQIARGAKGFNIKDTYKIFAHARPAQQLEQRMLVRVQALRAALSHSPAGVLYFGLLLLDSAEVDAAMEEQRVGDSRALEEEGPLCAVLATLAALRARGALGDSMHAELLALMASIAATRGFSELQAALVPPTSVALPVAEIDEVDDGDGGLAMVFCSDSENRTFAQSNPLHSNET